MDRLPAAARRHIPALTLLAWLLLPTTAGAHSEFATPMPAAASAEAVVPQGPDAVLAVVVAISAAVLLGIRLWRDRKSGGPRRDDA